MERRKFLQAVPTSIAALLIPVKTGYPTARFKVGDQVAYLGRGPWHVAKVGTHTLELLAVKCRASADYATAWSVHEVCKSVRPDEVIKIPPDLERYFV